MYIILPVCLAFHSNAEQVMLLPTVRSIKKAISETHIASGLFVVRWWFSWEHASQLPIFNVFFMHWKHLFLFAHENNSKYVPLDRNQWKIRTHTHTHMKCSIRCIFVYPKRHLTMKVQRNVFWAISFWNQRNPWLNGTCKIVHLPECTHIVYETWSH